MHHPQKPCKIGKEKGGCIHVDFIDGSWRVALVVGFAFLSQNFGKVAETHK